MEIFFGGEVGGVFLLKALNMYDEQLVLLLSVSRFCSCLWISLGDITVNDDNVRDGLDVRFSSPTYRAHMYEHVGLWLISRSTNRKLSSFNIGP